MRRSSGAGWSCRVGGGRCCIGNAVQQQRPGAVELGFVEEAVLVSANAAAEPRLAGIETDLEPTFTVLCLCGGAVRR